MKAEEIISTTHRLEQSGMARTEAETIVSILQQAVAPLATRAGLEAVKADLEAVKETMATKADLEALKETMATKAGLEAVKETMATKAELEAVKKTMATKTDLESYATRTDLAELEARLFWRLSGAMLAMGTFILAGMRFMLPT